GRVRGGAERAAGESRRLRREGCQRRGRRHRPQLLPPAPCDAISSSRSFLSCTPFGPAAPGLEWAFGGRGSVGGRRPSLYTYLHKRSRRTTIRTHGEGAPGGNMDETYDTTPRAELLHADWRKSAHSNPSGNCVELARLPAGQVAVRNSRQPRGPVLICAPNAVAAFIHG